MVRMKGDIAYNLLFDLISQDSTSIGYQTGILKADGNYYRKEKAEKHPTL